ncbi:MAG: hypothetical protein RL685_4161, partial [Pseudomonadota bacterium]|jgi:signal transduction histidine kinase/DNA-binding response OmpR family regulator/HPt (histidine-containing phosphotransfer) domain-containing protein
VLGASAALAVALLFVRRYVTPILRLTEQTSRELERTAKAALASAEAKSQFLANMSHEIRTPMNGVFGMLHLVQQTRLDGEQKRYLNVISSSARSLLKVVNDILDFSKLNARGYQLAPEPCSPERLVDETLLLLSERAREKGLALSADVEASTPAAVLIDGDRFRQILNNLLGNAIKFTDQGSVQVSVRARATEGPSGQLLEVAVSDTGPGIPEGAQSRLFQAFSQVDESSRRAHEGTGLGLAISKQLIELMGGQIGYRRLEAGGSCFQFTLPVQPCELAQLPAHEPAARAAESSSSAGVAATTALGALEPADGAPAASTSRVSAAPAAGITPASSYAGRPILLVDDNEVNQIVAVEVLEHLGFAVDVAASGQDAIDAALSKSYALILMDCQMPGMDGYEATREIRRLQQGPHLPIVAFTAHALPEERDKVLRSGMDDILLKPIDPVALAAVLTRHLGSARGSLRPSRRAEPTPLAAPSSATPSSATPSSAARPRLSTHAAAPSRPPRPETEVVLVPGLRRPPRAVATFLRQTPAELQSLLGAVHGTGRGAEREELRRIAHKLKGSAGSLGAPELAGLCEELQDTALVAPIAQLAELVQAIERAHQRASAALEQQTSKVSTA